jgi:hypothetical protein
VPDPLSGWAVEVSPDEPDRWLAATGHRDRRAGVPLHACVGDTIFAHAAADRRRRLDELSGPGDGEA